MASDVMASIYIDHEFPTRGMREMSIDEEDIVDASPEHFSEKSGHDATLAVPALDQFKPLRRLRPQTPRSSTDPTSTYSSQNILNPSTPVNTHRNRSPYSRSHLRSRSSGTSLATPGMARAHSWAGYPAATTTDLSVDSTPPAIRTPVRTRSPFKPQEDTMVYNTPQKMWYDGLGSSAIESIQEDSELDITPRGQPRSSVGGTTISRSSSLRRRPASPLHGLGVAGTSHSSSYPADHNTSFGPITYHSSSPSLAPQKFNEAYPSLHHYASSSSFSSISSTPTSQRSRSPSISSLETIEDVPDLEIEAIETERLERFKLAAERAENGGEDSEDGLRRRSLDTPRGFGFRTSGTREKKRWSVCGAERRADLDLETIWED